jgi:hypothetical protein
VAKSLELASRPAPSIITKKKNTNNAIFFMPAFAGNQAGGGGCGGSGLSGGGGCGCGSGGGGGGGCGGGGGGGGGGC